MKKLLSLFLALCMMLGAVTALGEAAPAEEAPEAGIPAAGDLIEGFEVKEIRDFPAYGAQLVTRGELAGFLVGE